METKETRNEKLLTTQAVAEKLSLSEGYIHVKRKSYRPDRASLVVLVRPHKPAAECSGLAAF